MMTICSSKSALVSAFACAVLSGCSKPDSSNSTPTTSGTSKELLAVVHWVGKHQLSQDPTATNLMSIWQLPESAKLESQSLEKLASAPWRLFAAATPLSNAPISLLRPLFDDVVQRESYLEVVGRTNQLCEAVFAIRLDPNRAALWENNLPVVLKSIGGNATRLAVARVGDWLLVSWADSRLKTEHQKLLADFKARVRRLSSPIAGGATNGWLSFRIDLPRVDDALELGWNLPRELPECDFVFKGDGTNTVVIGALVLKNPLKLPLPAWQIPANAIPTSLTSFTAWRALSSVIMESTTFAELQVGTIPDQVFVWSLPTFPMQSVLAAALGPNSDQAGLVQDRLLTAGNSWIASNSVGQWKPIQGAPGVQWEGAPFMTPFARPFGESTGHFLAFGLIPTPLTNSGLNREIPQRLLARTNAVYYDWEFTGPRIESWFYIGQLARVIFGRGQLAPEAAATVWLKALQPRLPSAGTVITVVSPTKLSLERTSTLGLTAFELHLFADWLESPRFPAGLHTTEVAIKRKLTGAPAAPPHQ